MDELTLAQNVKRALYRLIAASMMMSAVAGCTSISYYVQSLQGHAEIMAARKSVAGLVDNPATPEPLRARLEEASAIRQFATDSLGLPDNNSYRSYVDVGRDYVTLAVFAAPEFSLAPMTWCVPVYGCVPYRGYFSKQGAVETATGLKAQGLDVHVSGVTAYSTLGWSSDPLLNTMLRQDDTYLAGLVFHELAHQRVYVNGDSAFNEAFAVAVETSGVKRWLRETGNLAGLRGYEAEIKRGNDFYALVAQARSDLAQIYDGPASIQSKRTAKAAAIERLRTRYRITRDRRWGGYRGYDAWFDSPINNAKLAATTVYSDQVPAFLHLFDLCSGNYARFYAAVRRLGALEREQREDALKATNGCGAASR
ncbi:MAG: aminopeptidase [Hyphomicrobiales bacterium]|nr:aminopeptidase [Hyphomicrobiales bacterium]